MAAKTKGKDKNRLPPFTPILNEEMDSKAYLALTGTAVKVLTWFKRIDGVLRKSSGGGYNGILDFTYSEAAKRGFARTTFSRAISELGEVGFIDIITTGGLRGAGRSNSKYKLSIRWRIYGMEVKPQGAWRRSPTEP